MKRAGRMLSSALTALTALTAVFTSAQPAAAADPAQAALSAWQRNGRPERLIVIRPGVVDFVRKGVLESRRVPGTAEVPMSWLVAKTAPDWIGRADDLSVVQLKAAVLLAPGTTLRIGRGPKKVLFTAGDSATSGTWIRGSGATLDIRETALAAADADGGEPADEATARPYLYMGAGGRLDITDSTVTGFGLSGRDPARFSGVTWGKGSTGSAVRTTFQGNRTGVRLSGSTGVRLSDVTAKDSVEDGFVLRQDTGTVTEKLTAQGNGRDGMTVGGTPGRQLAGVATRDNKRFGVRATPQQGLRLTGADSLHDHSGIRLLSCRSCTLTDAKVRDTAVALSVSGSGSAVTVTRPELEGGTTGISLGADTASTTVTGGAVSGFDRGVAVSGHRLTITGTQVNDARTGIAVTDKANGTVLRDVTVNGSAFGAGTGVDLRASASLDGLTVSGTHRGVHLAAGVSADAKHLDVLAERKGVQADRAAVLELTDSRVRAPSALTGQGTILRHGSTEVSLPPFPWLGFAAIMALLAAIALQSVHQVRHRRAPQPRVAQHVRNTV